MYSPTKDVDDLKSKTNKDLENDDSRFRFSNGTIVRRPRLGIKATLYDHWFAELDLDFAFNEVEIKDMYMGYRFNDHWNVKLGNFKVPMSMERLTSSKYISAAERPMPVEAFADGRRLGISGTGWGRGWFASAGAFGRSVDIIQKERNRGNASRGLERQDGHAGLQRRRTTRRQRDAGRERGRRQADLQRHNGLDHPHRTARHDKGQDRAGQTRLCHDRQRRGQVVPNHLLHHLDNRQQAAGLPRRDKGSGGIGSLLHDNIPFKKHINMRFSTLKHLSLVVALLCGTAHTYAQQVFYE